MRFHPFQPRVVYRQVVLSPARWLLPPDLTAARERACWPQAIRASQAQTVPSPPDIVVIEDGDRLLPLDPRGHDDRELLRGYVGRGARSVTEQPGSPDAVQAILPGPEGDHVLELVLSLDRRMPAPAPRPPAFPRPWDGEALPPTVDAVLPKAPREAFLVGTPLAEAYGDSPVVTHRDKDGVATSSASAPGIVAAMLAQLDVRPGQRILEIGAGTGYNAALLACLAGLGGQVTTIELDPASPPRQKERSPRPGARR